MQTLANTDGTVENTSAWKIAAFSTNGIPASSLRACNEKDACTCSPQTTELDTEREEVLYL